MKKYILALSSIFLLTSTSVCQTACNGNLKKSNSNNFYNMQETKDLHLNYFTADKFQSVTNDDISQKNLAFLLINLKIK